MLGEEHTLNQINETSNLVSQKNISKHDIDFNVQESQKLKNNNSNFDGDGNGNISRIYNDTHESNRSQTALDGGPRS